MKTQCAFCEVGMDVSKLSKLISCFKALNVEKPYLMLRYGCWISPFGIEPVPGQYCSAPPAHLLQRSLFEVPSNPVSPSSGWNFCFIFKSFVYKSRTCDRLHRLRNFVTSLNLSTQMPSWYLPFGCDCFRLQSVQFIIQPSSYHSMLCGLGYWQHNWIHDK